MAINKTENLWRKRTLLQTIWVFMCINKDNSRNRINRLSCLKKKTTHSLFTFIPWILLKCIFIQCVKIVRVQSSCNLFLAKDENFSSKNYFVFCKKKIENSIKEILLYSIYYISVVLIHRKLKSFLYNFLWSIVWIFQWSN